MIAFSGNPWKLEKMLLHMALSAKMGPLIKSAMEPLEVLAGFCAINVYFQHCLVILLKPVNKYVSQISLTITKYLSNQTSLRKGSFGTSVSKAQPVVAWLFCL